MNRNFFIDFLKIAMSFAVVGIHVDLMMDINPTIGNLLVNGIFRIAVPVFFLINGYFFYDAIQKKTQRKWIKKLIFLYVFWSLIYSKLWIGIIFHGVEVGAYALSAKYASIFMILGFYHLWYLSGIIGAALITMAYYKKAPEQLIIVLCILLYGFAVYMNYYLVKTDIMDSNQETSLIYKNFLFFAFPFFYLGFYINKHNYHDKITVNMLYIVAIISTATLLIESYSYQNIVSKDEGVDCYLSLLTLSVSLFILTLKTKKKNTNKNTTKYASGIYLFHVYILEKMQIAGITNSIQLMLVVIILSTLSCYILIRITKNRPLII